MNADRVTGSLITYINGYVWPPQNNYLSGLSSGTFNHYELTREETTVRLFFNCSLRVTTTFSGSIYVDTIGAGYAGSFHQFFGNIDEVIITNECLHTASFTPPTGPY
jgi:hypothetical protein